MIIFYNKKTGEIEGTINGRIHNEGHMKMWVGDERETDRIVVNWKVAGEEKLKDGRKAKIYKPDLRSGGQAKIFEGFERGQLSTKDYKVDVKTKKVVKK